MNGKLGFRISTISCVASKNTKSSKELGASSQSKLSLWRSLQMKNANMHWKANEIWNKKSHFSSAKIVFYVGGCDRNLESNICVYTAWTISSCNSIGSNLWRSYTFVVPELTENFFRGLPFVFFFLDKIFFLL